MPRPQLVNYVLYQVGWFACVLGGAPQRPWIGFLIGLVLVGVHLALVDERAIEFQLVGLAVVIGTVIELFQLWAGTYRFSSGTASERLPPPWLLVMWAQFATTFRFSMRGVVTRPFVALLFGAFGGPLAFLAGERLGAVTLLPPVGHGMLRLSVTWAAALIIFSSVVRTLAPDSASKYRRVPWGWR